MILNHVQKASSRNGETKAFLHKLVEFVQAFPKILKAHFAQRKKFSLKDFKVYGPTVASANIPEAFFSFTFHKFFLIIDF